jgi:hypothetical protein
MVSPFADRGLSNVEHLWRWTGNQEAGLAQYSSVGCSAFGAFPTAQQTEEEEEERTSNRNVACTPDGRQHHKKNKLYTIVLPDSSIRFPRIQLFAVYLGPIKRKIKEINGS